VTDTGTSAAGTIAGGNHSHPIDHHLLALWHHASALARHPREVRAYLIAKATEEIINQCPD
jgi:hypothetical protein